VALCGAAAKCKTRAEEKQVDEQAIFTLNSAKREEIENAYLQFCTDVQNSITDQLESDKTQLAEALAAEASDEAKAAEHAAFQEVAGKSLEEVKKDLLEKKYAFYKARDVVVLMKAYVMELTSWVVVGHEMKSIIAAAALLLGFKKESVYMKKKDGLHWEKLVELLAPALFDTVGKVDVAGVRKELQDEQKLSFIKPLAYPGEFSETSAEDLSPAFKALFIYVRAAFEYRYADVKFRQAEMDAKEKAATAGGEEGAPAPAPTVDPADIDDDFADIASIAI